MHLCQTKVHKSEIKLELSRLAARLNADCSKSIDIKRQDGNIFYDITFTKLRWVQAANNINFKAVLTTPMNYPLAANQRNVTSYGGNITTLYP